MGVRCVYGPAQSQGTVGRGAGSPFEAVLITARVIVCVRVPTVVGGAVSPRPPPGLSRGRVSEGRVRVKLKSRGGSFCWV